jgi:hypothetical protein
MNAFLYALIGLVAIALPMQPVNASVPILSFDVVVAAPTTLASNAVASAQYQVTNNSVKTQVWNMVSIAGVVQVTSGSGDCANPFTLASHESCILNLQLIGSEMGNGVHGGPIVCAQNNSVQCYQPAIGDVLDVTIIDTIFADGFESAP